MIRDTISRVFRSSFPDADDTHFRTQQWILGTSQSPEALKPLYPSVLHAFSQAGKKDSDLGIRLLPENPKDAVEERTYYELCLAAQHYAARLAAIGVARGDRVLIVLPTSLEFVVVFFAVQLLRAIPVPSYPPALLERAEVALGRLEHIAEHSRSRWCVANRKLRTLLGEICLKVKTLEQIITTEHLETDGRTSPVAARARSSDPGFIQYTSGSTGNPKGVLLSHRNLVSNIHAIGQALRVNHTDRVVSWLPLYHDMGLIGALLFAIYWRLPLALMSPTAFLMQPARWLWAIHDFKGTLSVSPNFGYARCVKRVSAADREGLDLSSWRMALNGAEPVNLQTLQDFERIFGPHGFTREAVFPVYGLAESSLAVSFPRPGVPLQYEIVDRQQLAEGRAVLSSGEGSMPLTSVGSAVPGHEVVVVDEAGERLPEREVGHIVVRGPSIMEGYYQNEEATRAVLNDGWLWTGDLGYFSAGQLYVAGRAKDLIIIRGRNYYAEDVETVAERHKGVRAGNVVAFGVYDYEQSTDLVVLVCETQVTDEKGRADIAERVTSAVQNRCGLRVDEVVLVDPGTIPKTSSGKRQRSLCRELYLKGELATRRTGKLRLAMVFARSGMGLAASQARRWLGTRREPD